MRRTALATAVLALALATPVAAQEESYTIADLEARCEQHAIPGFADSEALCRTVLALILFPDAGLPLPDIGGGGATDAPMTVTGDGMQDTAPFQLSGGDYVVTVDAMGDCYHGSHLVPTSGSGLEASVSMSPEGARESTTTYVYDLAPGRYYWNVNSGCDWAITISPA